MKRSILSVTVAAAVLLLSGTAAAQGWPPVDGPTQLDRVGAEDAAVIVSVEDYAFLPDIPSANKNAADWERFLKKELGVRTVLTLSNTRAVREEILAFTDRAAQSVGDKGTLWFIFIGHGAPSRDGKDGILIGADGQQNITSIEARGVRQRELIEHLRAGTQGRTVMLIDACFSGRDRTGSALAKGSMPVMAVEQAVEEENLIIMTAARGDELAGDLPSLGRPAFSYLALGAMRGWGDDGDGTVTAGEVVAYARGSLLNIAGRTQTPQLVGDARSKLSGGTLEAAPQTVSAQAAGPTPVSTASVDGIPDLPIYLSAQLGVGTGTNAIDIGAFGTFTAGYKLNYGTYNPNEWRIGARLDTWASRTPNAPEPGDLKTNSATGELSLVDDNDGIEGVRAMTLLAGLEFSRAWRRERPRTVDTVSVLGVFAGGGAQLDQCQAWELDSWGNQASCTERASNPVFGGGVFGQAQWGPLVAGVQAGYTNVGLLAVVSLGLTVDP